MRKGMRKAASFSRLSSAGRHEGSFTRPPILARLLSCTLVLGCAALLGLPTSASAGTILVFGQVTTGTGTSPFVHAAFSGDTATLTTNQVTPTTSISIPVEVTQIGNVLVPATPAFETFVGVTSSTPQTGDEKLGFSGEIIISTATAEAGYGSIFLATTFSGGTLKVDGGSGSLAASVPLNTVNFTTQDPSVEAVLGGTTGVGAFALSFAGITPSQSVPFAGFTTQNSGVFSTVSAAHVIPEPASIAMALWAVPLWAVLGMLGYRPLRHRYKSSKA